MRFAAIKPDFCRCEATPEYACHQTVQEQMILETRTDLANATGTIRTLDRRVIFSENELIFNARKRIYLTTSSGLFLLQVQREGFRQTKRIRIEPQ